jgi:hypothetical protein
MAQWYLVTLGIIMPKVASGFGAPMPEWWNARAFHLPGITWHLDVIFRPSRWFSGDAFVEPMMWLNAPGLLVAVCILPLFVLATTEFRARGPRPAHVSRLTAVRSLLMWPLMAPITLVWASMPALHAQWRLASGRGLVYRVAEKGNSREAAVPASPELDAIMATVAAELAPRRERGDGDPVSSGRMSS